MFEAAATDFPFVAELPKREKSRAVQVWEAFRELSRIAETEGAPIPQAFAAKLLGISHQRVSELANEGRLKTCDVNGVRFVTENSVVAYAKSERKAGRPVKLDEEAQAHPVRVMRTYWQMSQEAGREIVAEARAKNSRK